MHEHMNYIINIIISSLEMVLELIIYFPFSYTFYKLIKRMKLGHWFEYQKHKINLYCYFSFLTIILLADMIFFMIMTFNWNMKNWYNYLIYFRMFIIYIIVLIVLVLKSNDD